MQFIISNTLSKAALLLRMISAFKGSINRLFSKPRSIYASLLLTNNLSQCSSSVSALLHRTITSTTTISLSNLTITTTTVTHHRRHWCFPRLTSLPHPHHRKGHVSAASISCNVYKRGDILPFEILGVER